MTTTEKRREGRRLGASLGSALRPKCVVAWIDERTQLPDSDTTVLIHCPGGNEPVWLGYHDGETWRCVDGERVSVMHWAEMPDPPNEKLRDGGPMTTESK